MKVTYLVNGSEYEFENDWDSSDEIEFIAQCIAEHFHNEHDGLECTWPLVFQIFINDESFGSFKVEREWSPDFTATQLEI